MPKLDRWSLETRPASPYEAPEMRRPQLVGNVTGHPRFADGDNITTSWVVWFDPVGKRAQTRNTLYELGDIDPDYAQWMTDHGHKMVGFGAIPTY